MALILKTIEYSVCSGVKKKFQLQSFEIECKRPRISIFLIRHISWYKIIVKNEQFLLINDKSASQ